MTHIKLIAGIDLETFLYFQQKCEIELPVRDFVTISAMPGAFLAMYADDDILFAIPIIPREFDFDSLFDALNKSYKEYSMSYHACISPFPPLDGQEIYEMIENDELNIKLVYPVEVFDNDFYD
jgi:hypothetical protein